MVREGPCVEEGSESNAVELFIFFTYPLFNLPSIGRLMVFFFSFFSLCPMTNPPSRKREECLESPTVSLPPFLLFLIFWIEVGEERGGVFSPSLSLFFFLISRRDGKDERERCPFPSFLTSPSEK